MTEGTIVPVGKPVRRYGPSGPWRTVTLGLPGRRVVRPTLSLARGGVKPRVLAIHNPLVFGSPVNFLNLLKMRI